MDRKLLYERINKRVDIMIENGLVSEVKSLLDMGYSKNLVSMQGIGYKEIIMHLEGNISLDEAIDMIKQETRRFAKRQLTWFRREKNVTFLNYEDFDFDKKKILEFMINDIKHMLKEEK